MVSFDNKDTDIDSCFLFIKLIVKQYFTCVAILCFGLLLGLLHINVVA